MLHSSLYVTKSFCIQTTSLLWLPRRRGYLFLMPFLIQLILHLSCLGFVIIWKKRSPHHLQCLNNLELVLDVIRGQTVQRLCWGACSDEGAGAHGSSLPSGAPGAVARSSPLRVVCQPVLRCQEAMPCHLSSLGSEQCLFLGVSLASFWRDPTGKVDIIFDVFTDASVWKIKCKVTFVL